TRPRKTALWAGLLTRPRKRTEGLPSGLGDLRSGTVAGSGDPATTGGQETRPQQAPIEELRSRYRLGRRNDIGTRMPIIEASVLAYVPWDREDAFRRRFSLVMGQKNQLWWDLPAADSFQLHREIYSLPLADFNRTLDELTELFNVKELTRQPVRELSLGERMKMELIAALLHQP